VEGVSDRRWCRVHRVREVIGVIDLEEALSLPLRAEFARLDDHYPSVDCGSRDALEVKVDPLSRRQTSLPRARGHVLRQSVVLSETAYDRRNCRRMTASTLPRSCAEAGSNTSEQGYYR